MKLLFDQNLSFRLLNQLAIEYPDSAHVNQIGLTTATDADVWAYARANILTIVSKDADFQQRSLLYGHPPKVVWLRLGNCTTQSILFLLRSSKLDISAFAADPTASFLALG